MATWAGPAAGRAADAIDEQGGARGGEGAQPGHVVAAAGGVARRRAGPAGR